MRLREKLVGIVAGARPADLLFLSYVALTGLLLAGFGWKLGPVFWLGLTAVHGGLVGVGLWFARRPIRGVSAAGFVRDAYPFLFIPYLYWELRYCARLFSNGFRDPVILRLEEALFGGQLAMTFSQALPILWLSELMHFFYATYWILLPMALAALYLRGRLAGFRELVFVELVLFFGCYLVYIFFPVAGPFYGFPRIGGELAQGPFYQLVHAILADGGSQGAAFPSSHVAVAVGVAWVTWRHDRRVFAFLAPLVVGLTVGTVYGRFHYGVDALSGVLVGLAGVPLALALRSALAGWIAGLTVGNARDTSLV